MSEMLLVQALRSFDDVRRGSEAWVVETERVSALIKSGFFKVMDTKPAPKPRRPKPVPEVVPEPAVDDVPEVVEGGEDQAEPA